MTVALISALSVERPPPLAAITILRIRPKRMQEFSALTPRVQETVKLIQGVYDLYFSKRQTPIIPTSEQRHYARQVYLRQLRAYKKTLNVFVLSMPVALIAMLILSTGEAQVSSVAFWAFRLLFWGFALVLAFNYLACPLIARWRTPKTLSSYDFYTPGRAFYTYPLPDGLLAQLARSHLDRHQGINQQIKQRIEQRIYDKGWIHSGDVMQIVCDVHIFHDVAIARGEDIGGNGNATSLTATCGHDTPIKKA